MTARVILLHGCFTTALLAGLAQPAPAVTDSAPPISSAALSQVQPVQVPTVDSLNLPDLLPATPDRQTVSGLIKLVLIVTVLSLAPAIIVMLTCFTRIIVVLALTRQALGTSSLSMASQAAQSVLRLV